MDLEETVSALAPGLLRYCLGRTGDRGLAEDVSQEALAALVQRWRRLGPPDCPEAFVFGIARRRAGRALWRRKLMEPLHLAGIRQSASVETNPEAAVERASEVQALARALRQLPHGDRDVLLLVAAGELETEKVARVLGLSRSAIKMRLHRARKRLRRLLEVDEGHARPERRNAAERR